MARIGSATGSEGSQFSGRPPDVRREGLRTRRRRPGQWRQQTTCREALR